MERVLFTSESVSAGHPDKMCDQCSDAILDAYLEQDSSARVAVEVAVKNDRVFVLGEVTSSSSVDIVSLVKKVIKNIGYDYVPEVVVCLSEQSHDIAVGVDETPSHEQGAGDQGLMFGYACDQTEEYMPLPIVLANKLLLRLASLRKEDKFSYLLPDAKSQVTVEYDGGVPVRCEAVVLSTQHTENVSLGALRDDMLFNVIKPVLGDWFDEKTVVHVNPAGLFVTGGSVADAGLTGRKIIVDTYGGYARHGGGAFSGKDPSKVDRSGAYVARYIAKHVVAAGFAKECEVQLAYAIGVADPVSVLIDCFGTETISLDLLSKVVREVFPLKPHEIISELGLLRPLYASTAVFGHFGRSDIVFPWERLDRLSSLISAVKK